MSQVWRNWVWDHLKHFKKEEFACPCCGKCAMDPGFLLWLDALRDKFPEPFIITSGYRCLGHNSEVGGKPDSAHLVGLAADIRILNVPFKYNLIAAAIRAGARGIGVGKDFIHLDMDYRKPHPVIWVY